MAEIFSLNYTKTVTWRSRGDGCKLVNIYIKKSAFLILELFNKNINCVEGELATMIEIYILLVFSWYSGITLLIKLTSIIYLKPCLESYFRVCQMFHETFPTLLPYIYSLPVVMSRF